MSTDFLECSLEDYMKASSSTSGQGQSRSNGRGRGRGRGNRRGRGRQNGFGSNPGSGPRNPLARDGDNSYHSGPIRNQRRGRYNRDEPYQTRADTDSRWSHDQYDSPASVSTSGGAVSTDGKIIISNLDPAIVDEDLKEIFSEFPIESFHINYDRDGRSLGTGEVVFTRSHHATKAVKEFDNAEVDGIPITVRLTTTGAVIAPRIVKKAVQPRPQRQPRPAPRAPRAFGGRGNNRGRRGRGGRGGRGGGARGGRAPQKKMTVEEMNKEMDDYRAAGSTTTAEE